MSTNQTASSAADQKGPSPSCAPTGHTHSGVDEACCEAPVTLAFSLVVSAITRVDPVRMSGAITRVVRSEELHHCSNVRRLNAALDALLGDNLLLLFGRVPQRHLARRLHGAGDHTGDADVGFAEIARERTREPLDR